MQVGRLKRESLHVAQRGKNCGKEAATRMRFFYAHIVEMKEAAPSTGTASLRIFAIPFEVESLCKSYRNPHA